MEDILKEIWPSAIKIGIPIILSIVGLTLLSINFYWRICSNMRDIEKYIRINKTAKGYKEKIFQYVGLFDIFYGFKPVSKFDKEYLKYRIFNEKLESIKVFRKFYRVVFLFIVLFLFVGIFINEYIIDK